ncbi:MAG: hypothetical protein LC623_03155 [Halobacteriales archaeon]|nr:hypothetical protein [Halobacteriales archaeon]
MAIDLVQGLGIVATLVLLEAVLSFDNAAILAVMSRKLPLGPQRRKALNYGLGIAYILRIAAILVAVVLVRNTLFLTLGGAYLVFLFAKHFLGLARGREEHAGKAPKPAAPKGFLGLTPLQSVILQIGIVDVAFALDQVVAAVAFTKDVDPVDVLRLGALHLTYQQALILTAATAGLISLRVLAPFISRLMDWLPLLEHMAFVAVGFVGMLLVLEHPQVLPSPTAVTHLLEPIKIPLTLGLFAVPVLVKLVFKVPKSHPHAHDKVESAIEAAQPLHSKKP